MPGIVGFGAAGAALADGAARRRGGDASGACTDRVLAWPPAALDGVRVLGDPAADGSPTSCASASTASSPRPCCSVSTGPGIAAHSGSACSSEALEPSPVLEAMGVDAHRSLRVSVGWTTTDDDIEAFGRALPAVLEPLRALARG